MKEIKIYKKTISDSAPAYIIAEIGLNHNGSLELAKRLIDAAVLAGCDAVKFQKRNPEKCVPIEQRDKLKETPWGTITYFEYRYKIEFGKFEYEEINNYCKEKNIDWLASSWDEDSLQFIDSFNVLVHKIPSAVLTNDNLIKKFNDTGKIILLSTGMSTVDEIDHAVSLINPERLILLHATSTYPCPISELNLKVISSYKKKYDFPIGYSGHEVGLQTTCAAVVLGAKVIERHITLDRAMWGSDHAASVEPQGFLKLVRDIRTIESALGDGMKVVYDSEIPVKQKLRFV